MGGIIKAEDVAPETRPTRQSKFKLQSPALKKLEEWLAKADKLGELPVAEVFEFDLREDIYPYLKSNKDPLGSALIVIKEVARQHPKLKAKAAKRTYAGKIYVGAADAFGRENQR
ncbi:MAG TPA: hypothetical protein VGT03_06570 [Candidatus Acidoferrales bacterium]|nr:hypothetical protein [Candidatus Acidoferrales bacterium]